MGRRRRKNKALDIEAGITEITSLSHDGRGVGRCEDGRVVFVDDALPTETVKYQPVSLRKGVLSAKNIEVIKASEFRVEAKCAVFGECGGCVLQHLRADKQIEYKQKELQENFAKIGHVEPQQWLEPMVDREWAYRRRARLGVKYVPKKGGVIVGFRERHSSFIQPTDFCEVLLPEVAELIVPLRETVEQLTCKDKIPQVEVSVADNAIALIVRHLEAFTQNDLDCLSDFAQAHNVYLYLQPSGLKSVHCHYPKQPESLFYRFDEFDIKVEFLPTDFIQVNKFINNRLVAHAIDLLDVKPEHNVLDLFCGVGNFTLPLSRKAKQVIGVEGDKLLVERAQHNIDVNQLDNVEFFFGDLFKEDMNAESHGNWLDQKFDRLLIDPPRSGAAEIVNRIEQFSAERIVYVSCNPATLARDAATLVNEKGYTLEAAGVIDMFPHTAHVESIAVFVKSS